MDARVDFDALLDRVLGDVDRKAFVTPLDGIEDAEERALLAPIFDALGAGDLDVAGLRFQINALRERGHISPRRAVILLQTLAAHPEVEDTAELARLIGEEEHLVLAEGGPKMAARLAVVDHHRAVHAFLLGRYAQALDLETRSAAARPWGDSLANILILLLRLDEEGRARDTLRRMRRRFPRELVRQVERYITQDPDLALLRDELPPDGQEAHEADGPDPAPDPETPCDPVLH